MAIPQDQNRPSEGSGGKVRRSWPLMGFQRGRKMLYLCMLLSILDCFVVIVFTLDFSAH